MKYIEFSIITPHAALISECLYEIAPQHQIVDRASFDGYVAANDWVYYDDSLLSQFAEERVIVYMADDEFAKAKVDELVAYIDKLAPELGIDVPRTRLNVSDEQDWANNWKAYYKPFKVTDNIAIKPAWESLPPELSNISTVFTIEPGLLFGTGTHETTALCLAALEGYVKEGDSVFDIGTGTGILAITSLLLGAHNAVAVDIDPLAEKVVTSNAALNNIKSDRLTVCTGDILTDNKIIKSCQSSYNIIVSNIIAEVIVKLIPTVRGLLADDGVYIMSGIIEDKLPQVMDALQQHGFTIQRQQTLNDWVMLAATVKK